MSKVLTATVIMPGWSLDSLDAMRLCAAADDAIVVGDAYKVMPYIRHGTPLIHCDWTWWKANQDVEMHAKEFGMVRYGTDKLCEPYVDFVVGQVRQWCGLSTNGIICPNSGYAGVSLAYLRGARKIALIGANCNYAPDGATHCVDRSYITQPSRYDLAVEHFRNMRLDEAGAKIFNTTPNSALTFFPSGSVEECLAWLQSPIVL